MFGALLGRFLHTFYRIWGSGGRLLGHLEGLEGLLGGLGGLEAEGLEGKVYWFIRDLGLASCRPWSPGDVCRGPT